MIQRAFQKLDGKNNSLKIKDNSILLEFKNV